MSESSQEPLTVACPRCHTRFRVREDQLAVAGGQVRCGVCLALFDATLAKPAETPEAEPAAGDETEDAVPEALPEDGRQRRGRRILLLSVGLAVATLALVFQVFAYQFDRWASQPNLRFIYEFACGVIGCALPAP